MALGCVMLPASAAGFTGDGENLARSMESILADEPSVHTLPDDAESDSPSEEAAPEVAAKPEPDKAPAAAAPKSAPADKADDDTESESVPDDLAGLKKALAAARGDKRTARKSWQEVEREKARLEGEIAVLRKQAEMSRQAPQAPQAQQDDPDAPFYMEGPAKFWQTREERLKQEFEQKLAERDRRQIERDRSAMLRSHDDFERAERAFIAAAQVDPSLADALRKSGDPVGFAYEHGKKVLSEQEDDVRARIYAELQQKGIDVNAEAPARQPARSPIPPKSIAGSRGSGAGVPQAHSGPRSMEDILRH